MLSISNEEERERDRESELVCHTCEETKRFELLCGNRIYT